MNPRKFFNCVSQQLHAQDNSISLRTLSRFTSNPSEIYILFCDKFEKNFSLSSDSSTWCCGLSLAANSASINVDVTTVHVALAQLREFAFGPDGLPAVFFKRLAYWLVVTLTIIYQQSLDQECILDDWRQAKVIALYKGKGDKAKSSSYRPISLTAVACKVERIVVDQLQAFILKIL